MSIYTKLADRVYKLLGKRGRVVTLRKYSASGGDYNPLTGKAATLTFVDSLRRVIVEDQPGSQIAARFGLTMEANTLISNKNKWIYMDGKGPQPLMQDHVLFDNIDYVVKSSQACSPAGIPVFFLVVLES